MKKIITLGIAIVMALSLCSCKGHSVTKTVSLGDTTVHVTEEDSNGVKRYTIEFETPEEAWKFVNG